jgi:hypothetical protein
MSTEPANLCDEAQGYLFSQPVPPAQLAELLKTGIGRKPRTGEEVSIPPRKALRFKPSKKLQRIEAGKKS